MVLDRLDAAFVARMAGRSRRSPAPTVEGRQDDTGTAGIAVAVGRTMTGSAAGVLLGNGLPKGRHHRAAADGPAAAIAERIVGAGRRVVAIAGAGTSAGLGAVAMAVDAALAERGLRVLRLAHSPLRGTGDADAAAYDVADVVLVVDGDWFPPGPIHGRRLVARACGYDGVVLVRPPSTASCPAHGSALGAIGIDLLATVPGDAVAPSDREGDS